MELLPCPFCGGNSSLIGQGNEDSIMKWYASCDKCGCSLGMDDNSGAGEWAPDHEFSSKEEAIKAWNTRTPPITQEDI